MMSERLLMKAPSQNLFRMGQTILQRPTAIGPPGEIFEYPLN